MEEFGPIQIMVLGVDPSRFQGEVLRELTRLKEEGLIRLVDLVVVEKSQDDELTAVELSDLTREESAELGALAGALVGLGAAGEEGAELGAALGARENLIEEAAWSIADTIPPGTTAAVALIEHRWAIPLRDAIRRVGGTSLADTWVHPEDLVAVGAAAR
jgi:uncharacterized membrane protein